MKALRIFLSVIFAALASLVSAQRIDVLPDPVFGNDEITINLTVINIPDTVKLDDPYVHMDNLLTGWAVVKPALYATDKRKGRSQVQFRTATKMTCDVRLSSSSTQSNGFSSFELHLITTPDDGRIDVKYDYRTHKCKIKGGRFARLNSQLNAMIVGKSTFWNDATMEGDENETSADFITLVQGLRSKYDAEMARLRSDGASTELLQLWQSEATRVIITKLYMLKSLFRLSDDESDALIEQLSVLELYNGNGYFYTLDKNNDYATQFTMHIYNTVMKRQMHMSEYARRAKWVGDNFTSGRYMTEARMRRMQREAPEYYEVLAERVRKDDESRTPETSLAGSTDASNYCELDRQLEGDSILPALLSRYKGTPVILNIGSYVSNDVPSMILNMIDWKSDKWKALCDQNIDSWHRGLFSSSSRPLVRFVALSSGEMTRESIWRSRVKYFTHFDQYLIMGYQYNHLCNEVFGIEDSYRPYTVIFDADGKQVCVFSTEDGAMPEEARQYLLQLIDKY